MIIVIHNISHEYNQYSISRSASAKKNGLPFPEKAMQEENPNDYWHGFKKSDLPHFKANRFGAVMFPIFIGIFCIVFFTIGLVQFALEM